MSGISSFNIRGSKRAPGTSETFEIDQFVRKVEGRTDLGRIGKVTAISGVVGGDVLVEIDGCWTAYDRQLAAVREP